MPYDSISDSGSSGYGRDLCVSYARVILRLCLNDITDANKLAILKKAVQVGIDYYGFVMQDCNTWWSADSGEFSGHKFPILFSGYMLNDANMFGIGSLAGFQFQEDGQTFYVDAADIGTSFNTNYNCMPTWGMTSHLYGFDSDQTPCGTVPPDANVYTTEHIGMPEWGIKHIGIGTGIINGKGLEFDRVRFGANYRGVNSYSWDGMVLAMHMLGLKTAWNHNAFFDYVDRYNAWTGPSGEYAGINHSLDPSFAGVMWDTYRADYGPVWTSTSTDLLFAPIGNKEVNEGSTLTFTIDVNDPNVTTSIQDHNLPSKPNFINQLHSALQKFGILCYRP
jgi:hypothetical protein